MNIRTSLLISLAAVGVTILAFIAFIFFGIMTLTLPWAKTLASAAMVIIILSSTTIPLSPLCALIEKAAKRRVWGVLMAASLCFVLYALARL